MYVFLVLFSAICLSGVESEIEDRLKSDFFNIYKHMAFEPGDFTNGHVTPDKVKYFLFTKNNFRKEVEIDPSHPKELNNAKVTIVFIIHGWTEDRGRQWYEDLKNAFLHRQEEYYVVEVDWSEPASQLYPLSSSSTRDVGNIIGEFLVGLHQNYSIPLENFLLIGHSLGGQICGFAGKKVTQLTGKKLHRIIALDPAGPFFFSRSEKGRLNKNDAEVVEVLHTDGGTFGFKRSCGTIDFFANGGSMQPGCARIDLLDITSVTEPVVCNHHRSWGYFIEAVLNPEEFVAKRCGSYLNFQSNRCDKLQVPLGNLKTRATGDFYFDTNKEKPFSRRKIGLGVSKVLSLVPKPLKLL